jgi:hypothetical protein
MAYNFMHEDTYDGSLMPKSTLHKALWGFIVSKAKPDSKAPGGGSVLLNPRLLIAYFPDQTIENIQGVIDDFCNPDPESRTTDTEGRRLLVLGRDRYAVTTYAKHAGSTLARNAVRKKEWRRRQQEAEPAPAPSGPDPSTAPVSPRLAGAAPPHVPRGTPTLVTSHKDLMRLAETHAFVGDNLKIPNALHRQLTDLMGTPNVEKNARLMAFYQTLNDTRGPNEEIPNLFKWVHAKFEPWLKAQLPPSPDGSPAAADDDAYLRSLDRSSARHIERQQTQEQP